MAALFAHIMRRLGRGALDVLYPPRCLACAARVPQEAPLCEACLRGLERPSPEVVRERLAALPAEAGALFASAVAVWRFDPGGALRALQHALKYQNRPRYGRIAGHWMGTALLKSVFDGDSRPTAVVPVPLHRARRLERGYNQSAELARGLADRLGVPCRTEALARSRPTRSQTSLSRTARWRNVAGAFEATGAGHALAAGEEGEAPSVVLVDDVLTTGATAAAAAQVLHRAGAVRVHLATLALAE